MELRQTIQEEAERRVADMTNAAASLDPEARHRLLVEHHEWTNARIADLEGAQLASLDLWVDEDGEPRVRQRGNEGRDAP